MLRLSEGTTKATGSWSGGGEGFLQVFWGSELLADFCYLCAGEKPL